MAMIMMLQAIPDIGLVDMDWQGTGFLSNIHDMNLNMAIHAKLGFSQLHVGDWTVLAQQFETDPFRGIREWFANLVATGQLWALIIGFIIGYLFRGFTSYG